MTDISGRYSNVKKTDAIRIYGHREDISPALWSAYSCGVYTEVIFKFQYRQYGKLIAGILASSVPMLFLILLVAVFVTSFIMMIIRFYKNLLTSEGYLMFTLPVSVSKLIWSKLIVIVIWMILSVIVGVIACLILVMSISDSAGLIYSYKQTFR